jgi:hypothetical protein
MKLIYLCSNKLNHILAYKYNYRVNILQYLIEKSLYFSPIPKAEYNKNVYNNTVLSLNYSTLLMGVTISPYNTLRRTSRNIV